MSYLSNEISAILEEEQMNQAELARLSGVAESKISRLINGQTGVKPPDLEKICAAITKDKKKQARILAARIRDILKGPGAELIEISIRGEPHILKETMPEPPLDPKVAAAWSAIRARIKDLDELRAIIISLGDLVSKGKP